MKRFLWTTVLLLTACSKPASQVAQPTPEPRTVYVVVTPTAAPEVAAFTLVPTPEPTAVFQTADVVVTFPAPRPTVDISMIPNMDREKPPDPKSLTEQMKECLSYSVTAMHDLAIIDGRTPQQLRVRVTNSCDVSFRASDSWFEARAKDYRGNVIDSETGRFQEEIRARGSAETVLQLNNCCNPRLQPTYEASVWWAAGGGKGPGE